MRALLPLRIPRLRDGCPRQGRPSGASRSRARQHESGKRENAKDRQQHGPADGAEIGRRAAAAEALAWRRRSPRPCRPVAASRRCAADRRRRRRRARAPRARIPARSHAAKRPMRHQAPAPDCDRQHQHDRGQAKKLDRQIGDDRAGRPSRLRTGASVAWLKLGSCTDQVASASGQDQREHEQRDAEHFLEAAARRAAEIVGNKVEMADARSLIMPCALTRARRQGDAAPRPWLRCHVPSRREYSCGPD